MIGFGTSLTAFFYNFIYCFWLECYIYQITLDMEIVVFYRFYHHLTILTYTYLNLITWSILPLCVAVVYFGADHNHRSVNLNEHDNGKGDEAVLPKLVWVQVTRCRMRLGLGDGGTENKVKIQGIASMALSPSDVMWPSLVLRMHFLLCTQIRIWILSSDLMYFFQQIWWYIWRFQSKVCLISLMALWRKISLPRVERAQLVMARDMAQWLC